MPGRRFAAALWIGLAVCAGPLPGQDDPPRRLNDAVNGGIDWQIGIPELGRPGDFQTAIRTGTALNSAIYHELDRELRRVNRRLEFDPDDPAAQRARLALRERLRDRVSINLDAGYFYAAGVYIELLETTGVTAEEIGQLTQTLRERVE